MQGKDVTANYYYDRSNIGNEDYTEDINCGGGPIVGNCADDVSSIYPLDTNDCYFNYSPKNAFNKQIEA